MKEYNTRIKLKSDTETNWIAANNATQGGFIPLEGELIIYSADNKHDYCRLKVGDGSTNVVNLPFIDAGTLNGKETEIVKLNTFDDRPQPGSSDKLYVDLSTNRIYHYDANSGYTQLSNFSFSVSKTSVSRILDWHPGTMTTLSINNNVLMVSNGILPELLRESTTVVNDITQG